MDPCVTFDDIVRAEAHIRPYITRTPLLRGEAVGLGFAMKAENLQRGGAFKIRGALTRLLALDPAVRARGVVTYSSGNHAQGMAIAAGIVGVPAVVVMPEDALAHKVAATRGYGAEVVQDGVTVTTRQAVAESIARDRGMTVVAPFDDPHIIAGQGTIGLEMLAQDDGLEAVVTPLGGGGLLAGVALALKTLRPQIRVYGVEPAAGSDGQQSLRAGRRIALDAPPDTLADGARTLCVGAHNFAIIRQHVDDIFTVDDDALLDVVGTLALRAKLVVEPTGALAAAAVMRGLLPAGLRAAVVLSGGNVSADVLGQALEIARRRV